MRRLIIREKKRRKTERETSRNAQVFACDLPVIIVISGRPCRLRLAAGRVNDRESLRRGGGRGGAKGAPLARFARFNYVRATQLRRGRLIAATSLPIDIDLNLDPISFSLPFAHGFLTDGVSTSLPPPPPDHSQCREFTVNYAVYPRDG